MAETTARQGALKRIVLAYSGGLDTSVILRWLKERYGAEVVAYVADVGQGDEIDEVRAKAVATGASRVVVRDLRDAFVRDAVFPALRANAIYETGYLLGTSLARPIIAQGQMDVVREVDGDAVSHGATGKGNDQVRFELAYYHFDPRIRVIAPWREWELRSRSDCVAYAEARGIPVPVTREKPYSSDRNLFHISFEGGVLEDPWAAPDESMFVLTRAPERAPDRAALVDIAFEGGVPVAVDGEPLAPVALLTRLNAMAGEHGVGRSDIVESRSVGMKCRGVYETPGGTVLHAAHRAVESITLDREVMRIRDSLVPEYARLIYAGYWFSPERETLQALVDETQRNVTGVARLKLYKGSCTVVGRRSERSLYRPEFATFERDNVYRQADAEGFIRISSLRLRLAALRDGRGA